MNDLTFSSDFQPYKSKCIFYVFHWLAGSFNVNFTWIYLRKRANENRCLWKYQSANWRTNPQGGLCIYAAIVRLHIGTETHWKMRTTTGRPLVLKRLPPLFFILLLLKAAILARGEAMYPELPDEYEQKQYGELFYGINLCAYKDVVDYDGNKINSWICGPVNEKDGLVKNLYIL